MYNAYRIPSNPKTYKKCLKLKKYRKAEEKTYIHSSSKPIFFFGLLEFVLSFFLVKLSAIYYGVFRKKNPPPKRKLSHPRSTPSNTGSGTSSQPQLAGGHF